jgi:hypothetical protein
LKKYKLQADNIDAFISALEEMIDAGDDMWHEEKYCNYKQMLKISEKRYLPAKKAMREALHAFIIEVIEEEA